MIVSKFEQQVEKFSEKPSIITVHKQLTYRELNNFANGIAWTIKMQDIKFAESQNNQIVSLLFEHSADMIVGVISTLKAEKIYVPLDITYPENRLTYMMQDSGTYLILTNTKNLPLAKTLLKNLGRDLNIINIDTIDNTIDYPMLKRTPSGDKPAYILYTSGSTGKPKGVLQNHENVCYYIHNWTERFNITSADRMTLFSAFSHDGAGQDMFGALLNGATLYPYNLLNRTDIAELAQWLITEEITIWHSVPTLYRYFVNTLKNKNISGNHFPNLRFILLGGEQIRNHDIDMFKTFFPRAVFANVYGQTESSVSSIWKIRVGDTINKMLIGDPLDKTKILLINENGEIIEDIGVGEIYIACEHLALGYWQDEERSAEVFLKHPELGRLYRTGDSGRLMADGSIEFMGRKDAQVKIRGFRIETGEIESILLKHEAIKEAVVIAKTDKNGNDHLCAYIVPQSSAASSTLTSLTVPELRKYLAVELPEQMIPSFFVELEQLPLIPSGKVDRKKLPDPEPIRPQLGVTYVAPETSTEEKISTIWKEVLNFDMVGIDDNFFDLGGTSMDIIQMMGRLHDVFHKDIPVVTLFRYPTIRSLAIYLMQDTQEEEKSAGDEKYREGINVSGKFAAVAENTNVTNIAVIGMAGRFPGARNIDQYWENLINGVGSISFFTKEELAAEGIGPEMVDNPNYVRARGIIQDCEYFDAAFFNFTPKEAEVMDPQLRILHECCWEALENAGCNPESYEGLIGFYAGNAANHYWTTLIFLNNKSTADAGFLISNYTTVVSYKLNLKGPSIIVQTACSTSLVAIHLASRGLSAHECDIALAGGISMWFPNKGGYLYEEGIMYSRDGYCRPFDAKASGTVFSNGAGIVALKRLEDAIADRNTIYAVIKGSGVNNDGRRKVGLASPSIDGQAEIIRKVYQETGINPKSISYVEAHGTATLLGDPVEIAALKLVYDSFSNGERGYCRIGSVKSNIGHLSIAAGAAGFIKTVLALKHRLIPPSLNFETPNPRIDFENSPFIVNDRLTEWKTDKGPLRAAVSAFGIGGTNAHIILEEAPVEAFSSESRPLQMLLLSAASKPALEKLSENLGNHLQNNPQINLADVAYTLQIGRKANKLRKMVLCSSTAEATKLLLEPPKAPTPETGKPQSVGSEEDIRPLIFMFSGQGAQYVNMGLGLYQSEPIFQKTMDRCFGILESINGFSIKKILYPDNPGTPDQEDPERINQTEITQPIIFTVEYSLAMMLMKWGFKPYAMIGHSIGEYVAACLSGVLSLEDALSLVSLRGKLMQKLPSGSMLSVPLSEEKTVALLQDYSELSLAAVNTTAYCVVSGPHEVVAAFEKHLADQQINCRQLHTSHAFHSAMMDAMLDEFKEKTREVPLNNPVIPYISNVTGKWITIEEATDPHYWAKHVRSAVRFADGLTELFKEQGAIFLEVGPGRTLNTFVNQHKDKKPDQLNLNLIRHPNENVSDIYFLLSKIGRLWLNGKKIDWKAFYVDEQRHLIPLPTYPFQRQPYWLPGNPFKISESNSVRETILCKKTDIAEWFYIPAWKSSLLSIPKTIAVDKAKPLYWLLFVDDCGIGKRLAQRLKERGDDVAVIFTGTGFNYLGNTEGYDEYTLNPGRGDDYRAILQERRTKDKIANNIVHLWNVGPVGKNEQDWQRVQELGFHSLIFLAQAIGQLQPKEKVRLTVVTDGMQAAAGCDILYPQKATITGATQVIPREYPDISCSCVDIVLPEPGTGNEEILISYLTAELLSDSGASLVAYRYNQRWLQTFEPFPLQAPNSESPRLKKEGVYLITGGLGGIGLVVAEYLARTLKAKLALTGRTSLPERVGWAEWLTTHESQDNISRKIREIQRLETLGAEIHLINANVTDKEKMQKGILEVGARFGKINGVIHSAGVPDGGLIQLRTHEMSEKILAPKVQGTLILDDLLKDASLDFFILCSSISAVTAPVGQVAYCAANNFLDHFAYYKTARDHIYTVSINWDAWREVGMAVDAVKQASKSSPTATIEVPHPLFHHCERIDSDQVVYISYLVSTKDWILSEHLLQGKPTLPGTGYLEMARAAIEHYRLISSGQPSDTNQNVEIIELKEFLSLSPLIAGENEEKELHFILKKEKGKDNNYDFSFISRLASGRDNWLEHARGKASVSSVTKVLTEKSGSIILREIESACSSRKIICDPEKFNRQQGALTLGFRWNSLHWIKVGTKQALAYLELPASFMGDINVYKLHPALLDVGNAILRKVYSDDYPYLPIYYKKVEIKEALPPKIFFHVRDAGDNKLGSEALKYDITIMDEQGFELVNIQEYTLKKVKVESHGVQELNEKENHQTIGQAKQDEQSRPYSFYVTTRNGGGSSAEAAEDILKDAISPAEGIEVFMRILGAAGTAEINALTGLTQTAVATTDLTTRMKKDRGETSTSKKRRGQELQENRPAIIKHARPALSNDYEAPRTEVEKRLAPIWEELLGIERVGIYDDFFELGGDSLKAVNFGAHIHKELNTEVPIPEFFNRPNIKQLAEYIEENNPDISAGSFESIPLVEEKEYYPLSTVQRRLYILNRLDETNLAYNLPYTKSINISFNKGKIKDILKKIIQKHDILRTSFHMIQGEPVQRVHPLDDVPFEVEYHDCSGMIPNERISAFVRPFDVAHAPLMRTGIIKIAENNYLFLIDFHHLVCDGVSYPLFFREFNAIYEGSELPPLTIQYKDYVSWKNLQAKNAAEKKQEEFWLDIFSTQPPVLYLPLDFPRPVIQNFDGSNLTFVVEKKETENIKRLAKEEEVTPYIIFLAVVNVLLMKLSDQEDIVVGTPVAGRRHADLEPLIGVFVNTLALRNYPTPDKTFITLLKELKNRTLDAFENQDYPFEELVDKVIIDRDLSRNPLFDVMFILHNELSNIQTVQYSGEQLQLRPYYQRVTSQFDLTFACYNGDEEFYFDIEYVVKLFKAETIHRFMNYLNQIINSVIANPAILLADMEIMTPGEKRRLLEEFNNTAAEFPQDKTIHELFVDQVAQTPDHIAIIGEPAQPISQVSRFSLTYRQLHEQSNQLASLLIEKGVLANNIVGIMLERSVYIMVGLLGILKAGGAYLPIDPNYPPSRITYILEQSSAPILITQKNIIGQYPDSEFTFKGEIIDISTETPVKSGLDLGRTACASNIAYVIYTSGSTGVPKGVMVRHRNVINFITGMTAIIPFRAGKTILAVTTISFDIFLLETLLPVTCGMTVAIANEIQQQDPRLLADFIVNREINMVQLTPSRLQLLLDIQEDLSCLAGVSELMVGGEAFPPILCAKTGEAFKGNLYNMYGPTETTVWSTIKDFSQAGSTADVTIGKPIVNTRVYIVDKNMRLKPLGVPGELLIGGAGVTAGYLNDDPLTKEKFLESPFVPGDILYRTGDLARRLENGEIDFLGRMDQQVKIRGFRIELAEIENQLLQRDNIKEAIVIPRNGPSGEKYLAAYIVYEFPIGSSNPGVSGLREFLARQLPEYMIPAYFIPLEKLPLTANGKIDRKVLPAPGTERPALKERYTEPGTQLEITVAAAWKEVLKLEKVGIDDNFFALGGNSLAVVSLNIRLREVLGRDIPVVAMFRYRTIRSFVTHLTEGEQVEAGKDSSKIFLKGEARKKKKLQMKKKTEELI